MREEVILMASQMLPLPDANHACRLRCSPQRAEELIEEIGTYYAARGLPATVYTSPACTPADLGERLTAHGYLRQEGLEAWLVLDSVARLPLPAAPAGVSVRRIEAGEAATFAQVFLAAFEMPLVFAPVLADYLEPSLSLPGSVHYLAEVDGTPVGTLSLLTDQSIGILGSAGVLPTHRRRRALTALAVAALGEARRRGVETLIVQTSADTPLERFLRISGFRRAFTRACYVLPWAD